MCILKYKQLRLKIYVISDFFEILFMLFEFLKVFEMGKNNKIDGYSGICVLFW